MSTKDTTTPAQQETPEITTSPATPHDGGASTTQSEEEKSDEAGRSSNAGNQDHNSMDITPVADLDLNLHTSSSSAPSNGPDSTPEPKPEQPGPEGPQPEPEPEQPVSTVEEMYPVTDLNTGVVGWDGQDDPANPRNFSSGRKALLLGLMASVSVVVSLSSSVITPVMQEIQEEFGVRSQVMSDLAVSIILLGKGIGPLFLAPLSEVYGRRRILDIANWVFAVFQIGCALAPNMKTLIICRFFSGLGGAGSIALAPGLIADLYPAENRGFGATVVGMGGLAGPVLGPVLGGFIGQQLGWRWEFWLLLIQSAIYAAALTILNVETYGPVLIRRKIRTLEIELLRDDLRSAYDLDKPPRKRGSVLLHGLTVPFVLLTRSLVIGIMSISTALIFGLLYLFFLTIPSVFENDYGFSASKTGLANLGLCLGSILTMFLHALTSDAWLRRLALKYNSGVPTPEMRLPLLTIYTLIMPVSFFWYGWAVDTRMSYIWPIVSTVPFAISSTGMFMVIVAYVIDSFPEHAASASAAITFARSMVGALLPLAGPAMFKRLGLGWGNSVLGFLSLLFVPIPYVFYRYGERMREVSPVL